MAIDSDSPQHSVARHWAVVPAAGVGSRMGTLCPKQYLELNGGSVIEHTLRRLADHPAIAGVVVAIAEQDEYWPKLELNLSKPLWVAAGGAQRCDSVLSALHVLSPHAAEHDWVLVHDAARPCLRAADLSRLIDELSDDAVGGLLALPVSDTVKRADHSGRVAQTVDRRGLWRALTPQMFRLAALREALAGALARGEDITDEAAAMESAGHRPKLVAGHSDNIKITHPEDLALAALYLRRKENSS
ncbi:MAG: 2-C-methyl-D-erythritol 4-phosphate cytidylyltransferase [Thiotrichales bacterium SG8_50]|nr:MAG: 2-C-methyl-D-erythritol 4-phosphate cytidylyltransferase [Thiotrichales bacterium SG8_50]